MLSGVQLDHSEKFVMAIHHATVADHAIFYKDATVYSPSFSVSPTGSFRYPLFCHLAEGLFGGSASYIDPTVNIIDELEPDHCYPHSFQMPGTKAEGYVWDPSAERMYLAVFDLLGTGEARVYRYEPDGADPSLPYVRFYTSPYQISDISTRDIARSFRAVRHDYFVLMGSIPFAAGDAPPVEYRFGGRYSPSIINRRLLITDIQRTAATDYCIGNTGTEILLYGGRGACHVMSEPR
jgi:hypothetical protein